jgi:hypothetical protein
MRYQCRNSSGSYTVVRRTFGRWCARRRIRQRFRAVGKYGSIAVVERFIRSMKNECTRRLLVPYQRESVRRELALYVEWYNGYRPHEWLGATTPDEVYFDRDRASDAPRIEPRPRWPRGSPCAAPQAEVRGDVGQVVELKVGYLSRRLHLPIVELKPAA